jgi:outer membrane biosynthesis protein TonB
MTLSRIALSLPGFALAATLLAPATAQAQSAELQECAKQYIAAKANPKFFEPWLDYYAACKKRLAAEPAAKAAAAPAPAPPPEAAKAEPPKPAPAAAAPAPAPKPVAAPVSAPAPAAESAKPEKPAHKPKKPAQHKPQT